MGMSPWICDRCGEVASGDMCRACGNAKGHVPALDNRFDNIQGPGVMGGPDVVGPSRAPRVPRTSAFAKLVGALLVHVLRRRR